MNAPLQAVGTVGKLAAAMRELGREVREAARVVALAPAAQKNRALAATARTIRGSRAQILAANAQDVAQARAAQASAAFIDRLTLNDARIEAMAAGIEVVRKLKDPVGNIMAAWRRPNGMRIERVRVPLGVIGVIYESRPNVTADAGALCLKAGNAAILRGGSESFRSSGAIMECLQEGLRAAGLPAEALQLVPTTDRAAVGILLKMTEFIDVIVPRGGRSLIERVTAESRIPLFQHLEGLNHTFVEASADLAMARSIVLNAKLRRTGVCGATETLLVGNKAHLAPLVKDLLEAGCEVRGDAAAQAVDPRVRPASLEDWSTEYLDAIISV